MKLVCGILNFMCLENKNIVLVSDDVEVLSVQPVEEDRCSSPEKYSKVSTYENS